MAMCKVITVLLLSAFLHLAAASDDTCKVSGGQCEQKVEANEKKDDVPEVLNDGLSALQVDQVGGQRKQVMSRHDHQTKNAVKDVKAQLAKYNKTAGYVSNCCGHAGKCIVTMPMDASMSIGDEYQDFVANYTLPDSGEYELAAVHTWCMEQSMPQMQMMPACFDVCNGASSDYGAYDDDCSGCRLSDGTCDTSTGSSSCSSDSSSCWCG